MACKFVWGEVKEINGEQKTATYQPIFAKNKDGVGWSCAVIGSAVPLVSRIYIYMYVCIYIYIYNHIIPNYIWDIEVITYNWGAHPSRFKPART
jgi:hypothetical protein